MKKLLCGSTALVAAGLLSGAAAAQEGITGSLSGWWLAQFAVVNQDDGADQSAANRRDHQFNRFGTITLSGDTTLENGLQAGVSFDWNTETVGSEVSRDGYVWMEFGGFRLELGSRDPASSLMGSSAPAPSMWGWGFNSPVFTTHTVPADTEAGGPSQVVKVSGNSEKLTLFTPRFGGFQLGASYTPEGGKQHSGEEENDEGTITEDGNSVFGGPALSNTAGEQSEILEIGANFVQSFDEIDLSVSGGWAQGNVEGTDPADDDQTIWGAGVSIGWMDWTFGSAYKHSNQATSGSNTDRTDWNVGVRYATGPWGVGIQYQETASELGTVGGEDTAERFEFGGQYEVGSGIAFQLGLQFVDYQSDHPEKTLRENESTALYVGTSIFF